MAAFETCNELTEQPERPAVVAEGAPDTGVKDRRLSPLDDPTVAERAALATVKTLTATAAPTPSEPDAPRWPTHFVTASGMAVTMHRSGTPPPVRLSPDLPSGMEACLARGRSLAHALTPVFTGFTTAAGRMLYVDATTHSRLGPDWLFRRPLSCPASPRRSCRLADATVSRAPRASLAAEKRGCPLSDLDRQLHRAQPPATS